MTVGIPVVADPESEVDESFLSSREIRGKDGGGEEGGRGKQGMNSEKLVKGELDDVGGSVAVSCVDDTERVNKRANPVSSS